MNDPIQVEALFVEGNQHLSSGQLREAVASFSALLDLSPEDSQALGNRALAYFRLGSYDQSLTDYLQALKLRPDAPPLLANFAVLLKELGQLAPAENLLLQALRVDPQFVDAWSNLGIVRQHQLRYDEAAQCHIKAMQIGAESPARWTNLGNAFTGGLHLDEAIESYQHALDLDADCHEARYNQSIPLLTQGCYLDAWAGYEYRWRTILTPRFTERRWGGEALGASTLLLWSEQGLGDNLQMARFIPQIRTTYPQARLVLSCPKSLHRLFAVFDGLELIDEKGQVDFDWQIPLASLPGVFRTEISTLPLAPYLAPGAALVDEWAARLPVRRAGMRRLGLVWQSGVWGVGVRDLCRQQKSIGVEHFGPLLDSADFISLQPATESTAQDARIHQPVIGDFADTAAIIANLDGVVSVDTAVAHLAGAMGWPVLVLMRHEGAPFFGARGARAPWYPSARILRQDQAGDWAPVLARLGKFVSTAGDDLLLAFDEIEP